MSADFRMVTVGMVHIENIYLTVGILFPSLTESEIQVLPVWSVAILFSVSGDVGGYRKDNY
jgi:hypothetical protein